MLYIDVIAESETSLTFRVHSFLGDAQTFNIWGTHTISRGEIVALRRRDVAANRQFDQVRVRLATLEELGKKSWPVDDDLPDMSRR